MNRMSGIRTGIALGTILTIAVGCKEGAPTPLVVGQEPQNSKPPATATADVTKTFTPLPSFTPEATLVAPIVTTPTEVFPIIPGLSVEPNFTFDQKAGMVVWDAKSWSTLKDSDKAQIVAWLGGQKINRIEIPQVDGAKLIELPNAKSFLPVKIASDANFEIVKDSKLNANVATINGKVFAKYDGSVWILGTKQQPSSVELQAEPLNQTLSMFPNLSIQAEMKGNTVILHLIKSDGKEFAYRKLGQSIPSGTATPPVYLWENMTTPEQNGVIDYTITHYQYLSRFTPDLQRQLHDGLVNWLGRLPDKLPTIEEIGLTGYVRQEDYDAYFNRRALLDALTYVNTIDAIPGNTNQGGNGLISIADAYRGDAMIAWFFKEAFMNSVGANISGLTSYKDTRIGYPENVSTSAVVAIAQAMSKLGGNPGVDIGNQLDKVKGKIPYPK